MEKKFIFAYTAGYFDGDGCFYCRKEFDKRDNRFQYRCGIQVTSTNKEIISFFVDNFGGSFCATNRHKKHPKWKPEFCFHIQGKKAIDLCNKIMPFLIEKKDEAALLCDFYKETRKDFKDSLIQKLKLIKKEYNLINKTDKDLIYKNIVKIDPSKFDYAYFAGFIDAECCLRINSNKIYLTCNNSKLTIFPWLLNRFGGNIYFIPRNIKCKKLRNQFQWYISSKALYKFLIKISVFLKYKKTVCEKLIEFHKTISPGKRISSEVLSLRESIIQQVHFLNLKGSN